MKYIFRIGKGTWWNLVGALLTILYYDYAPLHGAWLWLGLVVGCAVWYIALGKLRERLRF